MAEISIQSELDFRRERAMQQYHQHPTHHHHRRRLAWRFSGPVTGRRHPSRPAVS